MHDYSLIPHFILRTPLLSLSEITQNVLSQQDEAATLAAMKPYFEQSQVQEALLIASPALYQRCLDWLAGKIKDGKDKTRLEHALFRYFLRMSTRATPFGLFAGCTLGKWGRGSKVVLSNIEDFERHSKLDRGVVGQLCSKFSLEEELWQHLKFFPNNSIYTQASKIRYIEQVRVFNHLKNHNISEVEANEFLNKIFETAQQGAYPKELAQSIVDEDISYEEAIEFVKELIDNQLLMSELYPSATNPEYLKQLVRTFDKIEKAIESPHPSITHTHQQLKTLKQNLTKIDAKASQNNYETYQQVAQQLDEWNIAYDKKRSLFINLHKTAQDCQLNNKLAGSIRKGIEVLNRLSPYGEHYNLGQFKQAFLLRYERQEVPLLEALDIEAGLGYPVMDGLSGNVSGLVDDILTYPEQGNKQITWNQRQQFLLDKYLHAIAHDEYEIYLEDEELQEFKLEWETMPDTLALLGRVVEKAEHKNDLERVYFNLVSCGATNLIARFTDLDPSFYDLAAEIAQKEQDLQPNAILAEIVHLPFGAENVVSRTAFRAYEIPFLSASSVEASHQVPVQDLYLSVRNNRIILRSKRLNKEIIPRLSNAHAYFKNTLSVYHFLSDLQYQGERLGLGFSWGELSDHYKFLPRVCYRNLIFSRATWQFLKTELDDFYKKEGEELRQAIEAWRTKWRIPQYAVLAESDLELFIDFKNDFCIAAFLHGIRKLKTVKIVEFIQSTEQGTIEDQQQRSYTNEFLMAFTRKAPKLRPQIPLSAPEKSPAIQREFALGSEWLYFKIYTGTKTTDTILTDAIRPIVTVLKDRGYIDQWFFIRYADPKSHLRLRFHLKDTRFLSEVLQLLHPCFQHLLQNKLAWNIQADTYRRELERYGYEAIELAEELFFHDSESTIQVVEMHEFGLIDEQTRWLYGIKAMDILLDAFGLDITQKMDLMKHLKTNFQAEFKLDKPGRKQLKEKYKKNQQLIQQILTTDALHLATWQELQPLLIHYTKAIHPIAATLANKAKTGKLPINLGDLMGSLVHMLCNRLFKAKQRKHEMVLYDFLFRNYAKQRQRATMVMDSI